MHLSRGFGSLQVVRGDYLTTTLEVRKRRASGSESNPAKQGNCGLGWGSVLGLRPAALTHVSGDKGIKDFSRELQETGSLNSGGVSAFCLWQ